MGNNWEFNFKTGNFSIQFKAEEYEFQYFFSITTFSHDFEIKYKKNINY